MPSWNALPVHGAVEVCKGHDLGLMMSTGISGAPIQLKEAGSDSSLRNPFRGAD